MTIAEKLTYWNEQVIVAETALAYAIGQRTLLLEQIMVCDEHMLYADPLEHVIEMDRLYGRATD